jgi:hypothetical protein
MNAYRVLHDAGAVVGSSWGVPWMAILLWLALAGVFFGFRRWRRRHWTDPFIGGVIVLFGLALPFGVVSAVRESSACRDVSAGRRGAVIEGVITDFDPMPRTGHAVERFRVGETDFAFSQWDGGCAFHQTQAFGSPLRPGQRVRIRHWEGKIMKLERVEER